MEFLKDPSLVLYSSSYTPLLSVHCQENLIHQQTTTYTLMILNFSYHFLLWISLITSLTLKTLQLWRIQLDISSNFLSLNPSKTEFLVFGLPQQLSKLNNPLPSPPLWSGGLGYYPREMFGFPLCCKWVLEYLLEQEGFFWLKVSSWELLKMPFSCDVDYIRPTSPLSYNL